MMDPQGMDHMAAAVDLRRKLPVIGKMGVIAVAPGFRFFYDGSALGKMDRNKGPIAYSPGSSGASEVAKCIISEMSRHPDWESMAFVPGEKTFVMDIAEERSYVHVWGQFLDGRSH